MALSITYEQIEAEILERGEARGDAHRQETIARNMLTEKMEIATIARLTGLTIAQVEALASSV